MTSIGSYAFKDCESLTSIDLPMGLVSMGEYCFANTRLTAIDLPETLSSLRRGCFSSCINLTEIVIPDSISQIAQSTFANCTGLKTVTMPIDLNFSSWDGYYTSGSYYSAYTGTTNVETIHYTPGRNGTMLERSTKSSYNNSGLADSYYGRTLEYISKDSLKTVTFAEGVTSIARLAFAQSALEKVTFHGDMPTIASDAFTAVTAEMYYPLDNATWEGDKPVCGGTLTWIGYVLDENGEVEIPEEEIPEPSEDVPEEPEIVEEIFEIEDVPTVEGVFQGLHSTWYDEIIAHHTASFDNLVPGEQYVLLVLAEADAEDLSTLAGLIEGVDCGAVLRELRPNEWKLSLRTGANGRVNATEAALDAPYVPYTGSYPATEVMFSIFPSTLFFSIYLTAACIVKNSPSVFVLMTALHSSGVVSRSEFLFHSLRLANSPALFTSISSPPIRRAASSIFLSASNMLDASQTRGIALSPIAFFASAKDSGSLPVITTVTPCSARRLAIEKPIPREAPVTIAFFPYNIKAP